MIVHSPRLSELGFKNAFSTREGNVSVRPYSSLNLARTIGDEPSHVAENSKRFAEALGATELYEVSQVHGAEVVDTSQGTVVEIRRRDADALLTREAGNAVAVRTADCVPILLADRRTGAVAAVHAGWRGVEAEIVVAAVLKLGTPSSLVAAIGPHIRVDAFEVSEEIAARIAAVAHGQRVVHKRQPRPHVDLALTVRAQLESVGVTQIDDVGGCTFSEPARFFSHRRDAGQTGRHLSAIVAR